MAIPEPNAPSLDAAGRRTVELDAESRASIVVDTSGASRERIILKTRDYGIAVAGSLGGYFVGTTITGMVSGEFSGSELVVPRLRFGRLGWMPRHNLIVVGCSVIGCIAASAAARRSSLAPTGEWPARASAKAAQVGRRFAAWLPQRPVPQGHNTALATLASQRQLRGQHAADSTETASTER